jgi:mannose-1-phosphate guanylyltransferase
VGEPLPPPHGAKAYKTAFFKAEQFVEKPHFDQAVEYVKSGHYRWNAGMFVWSFVTLTEGLSKHEPTMAEACQRWFKVAGTRQLTPLLAKEYPELTKISIDYALMEKAHNVVVADGAFPWDDVGSWTALGRHLKADSAGNCAVADFVHVDAARNIIYDARSKNRTPVAFVGLRDAILVITDDAVMAAHKSQAQKVKALVNHLATIPMYQKLI